MTPTAMAVGGQRCSGSCGTPVQVASTSGSFQKSFCQRPSHRQSAQFQQGGRRSKLQVSAAASTEEQEDLLQYAEREKWYTARFCADDAPDWNPATFVRSRQITPKLREVVLDCEISRELVPLRNAYKHVGQRALLRMGGGVEEELTASSAPFAQDLNKDALYRVKGDITAGEIKLVKEISSVRAELRVLVPEAAEGVYQAQEGDLIELGPFQGTGLELRGPIIGIFAYPTIVIFCEGLGIGVARALIECGPEEGGLLLSYRQDVRLYYRAQNQDALCFKDLYEEWETKYNCKVVTSTRESFQEMFDYDDTLAYEPITTAAVILTAGDEEAEKAARLACTEAEITCIIADSKEQEQTKYL